MTLEAAYRQFDTAAADALEWLAQELATLRTGRVTTLVIAAIPVEHYGTRTPLNGLASITQADARTLVVSPWDASATPAIQKALVEAQLGVQPAVDGKLIRLSFPSLTSESRVTAIKKLHRIAEDARVRLRRGRDEALAKIRAEKESGDLTEDDFYLGKKELDDSIAEANKKIAALIETKETEIKQV